MLPSRLLHTQNTTEGIRPDNTLSRCGGCVSGCACTHTVSTFKGIPRPVCCKVEGDLLIIPSSALVALSHVTHVSLAFLPSAEADRMTIWASHWSWSVDSAPTAKDTLQASVSGTFLGSRVCPGRPSGTFPKGR